MDPEKLKCPECRVSMVGDLQSVSTTCLPRIPDGQAYNFI